MADWNSLLDDPLFNAGLGLLSGAPTANPWGVATEQLNKFQALRQNREYQRMHAKVYEAQARKAEQEAQQAEQAQARWGQFLSQLPPEQQAAAAAFGPKEFGGEYMKARVFPKLENELAYTSQGREQRVLRNPYSTQAMPLGGFKQDISNADEIAGQVAEQQALLPGKMMQAAAGATRVNVPVSLSTEKKYGEQFASKMAEGDAALLDAARKAPDLADRSNRITKLLDSGKVITGTGANFRLEFAKAAALAGMGDGSAANTEALAADLAKNTLDSIKASGLGGGTGFSNADREFLEKAVGGLVTMESGTLRKLAELSGRAANLSVDRWHKRVSQIPDSALEGTGITRDKVDMPKQVVRRVQLKNGKTGIEYSDGTRIVE
jgi:hypothetical protein